MKKILHPLVFAGVLMSGLIAAQAFATTEAAKVNDTVITLEDVNTHMAEAAHASPGAAVTRKTILDEMIKREAAVQEARKMHLDQDPAVMERLNNVLFFAYIEKKLQPEFDKMTISDSEAKSWYEKNPEIRTSHIFVAIPPNSGPDAEQSATQKLKEVLAEIRSGKVSFAEAAQKNSEDPSASMGGDLEYRMQDRLDPSYYHAAIKLGKVGDITAPIKSSTGMHLIRLTGKHNWTEVDRIHVKRIIFEQRREDLVNRFLAALRQKAKVSVNDKVLN